MQDDGNGMYYMRARYFNVDINRFINEDPIKSGLNWYGYVNGNPVSYTDPLGLKALLWNEDDNYWFPLKKTIKDTGGSVDTWNRNTNTTTVSVYGTSVSFTKGRDGVEVRSDGKMYVRADILYNKIMATAKELVFMGTHGVGAAKNMADHASIIVMVYNDHKILKSDYGKIFAKNNTLYGNKIHYATIGAAQSDGENKTLLGRFNRDTDRDLKIKKNMWNQEISKNSIYNLFENASYFIDNSNGKLSYDPVVWNGYNSNSFAFGLLEASGIKRRTPKGKYKPVNLPGKGKPVAKSYYGVQE